MPTRNVSHKKQSPLPQEDPLLPDEEWVEIAPDGGWGWLVLGGTLLVSMLIPGTIKSFGVLFVEFLEVFQATPAAASWIPALCYFLYCSLGPFSSWMCVKTSYRTVTIIGGLFAASGMILSYFASSILFLCFSYGILVGTGAGLSYPPGIFIVTSYFVKLRGLANGLAVSGSAFGSIILPPFLRYLLENYGYRGATLIMGGLTLNVLVGALLYEPVERHMKRVRVKKTLPPIESPEKEKLLDEKSENGFEDVKIKLSDIKVSDVSGDVLKPGEKRIMEVSGRQHQNATLVLKGVQKPLLEVPATKKSRKISSPARFSTPNDTGPRRKGNDWPVGKASRMAGSASHMTRKLSMGMGSNMSTSSFRYVSTAWHGSTLVGLRPDLSSSPNIKKEDSSFNLCGLCPSKTGTNSEEDKTSIKSLLKDPLFVILLLANATSAIGYTNFIILIPAYAIEIGYDKDMATYLLSIVAALDLVGRVGGAALSDFLKIDKCIYFFGGLLVSGISLAVLPCVSSYPAVAFLCGMFGLASGTYIGITAVIMVDLLGEELLASSYGLSLFVNGVLQLIGPPICGIVYEQLRQYGLIFALLGLTLVLGGASWMAIPFARRKNKNVSV